MRVISLCNSEYKELKTFQGILYGWSSDNDKPFNPRERLLLSYVIIFSVWPVLKLETYLTFITLRIYFLQLGNNALVLPLIRETQKPPTTFLCGGS